MKRISTVVCSLALAMGLSACGAKTEPAAENKAAPAATANANGSTTPTTPTAATNTAAPAGDAQMSDLKVTNRSGWAIHELYMAPSKSDDWGPDQLANATIEVGSTFTLNGIPCGTYDIRVVDEDGDECVIEGETFCGTAATWDLTKDELLGCQGFGE